MRTRHISAALAHCYGINGQPPHEDCYHFPDLAEEYLDGLRRFNDGSAKKALDDWHKERAAEKAREAERLRLARERHGARQARVQEIANLKSYIARLSTPSPDGLVPARICLKARALCIYSAYLSGLTQKKMAEPWGISQTRAHQVAHRMYRTILHTRMRKPYSRAKYARPIELDSPEQRDKWHEFTLAGG